MIFKLYKLNETHQRITSTSVVGFVIVLKNNPIMYVSVVLDRFVRQQLYKEIFISVCVELDLTELANTSPISAAEIKDGCLEITYFNHPDLGSPITHYYDTEKKILRINVVQDTRYVIGGNFYEATKFGYETIKLSPDVKEIKVYEIDPV